MIAVAANGILVLVPSALWLHHLASRGEWGSSFYAAQAVELAAGLTNLVLMGLNIRDGLRLSGRLRKDVAAGPDG